MILGSPMGVLHTTGRAGALPAVDELSRVEALAVHSGARIGTLRATASTELAATTDPLTGLLNRRSLTDRLEQLTATGSGYAVAFADLDSFKALNDTYGHTVGDQALRLFAQTLRAVLRDSELICRYGGEEFVVVLPECTAEQAAPVVHRIREELRAATTRPDCPIPAYTASFGVADSTYALDATDVIDLADRALLQAKKEGKDRLILADRPDTPAAHTTAEHVSRS
jgi:diguanylate cyclase (GGDEF)-like protein